LEALTSKIVNNLRAYPSSVRVEALQGGKVLVIDMPSTPIPVAYRGHYYRRVGNTTQEIAPEGLGYFLMQRSRFTWDGLPGPLGLDALDPPLIRQFARLAQTRLPQIAETEDPTAILRKLRLLVEEQPTNAAILLFGGTLPQSWQVPQVHMGRFKDDMTILDDKQIAGTLFQQLEQIMQLFPQYIQVRYNIPTSTEGKTGIAALQRQEIWDYPLSALREAVVNALIHRDYTSHADIHIRVYDAKVIISNPGPLPEGLTVADLKRDQHDSIPRNPLLAQVFYFASLVERWGTGTTRMRYACREQGLPEPEFLADENRFTITFLKNPYTPDRLAAQGFTERQITILRYVLEHGKITNREYREQTGVSDESARQELNELVQAGMLIIQGKGRGVHYVLARVGN
jgi:ATP-dependent DNA helicase RecG